MENKKKSYWIIFILFGIVLYSNTIQHNYVLDDYSVIKENRIVQQGIDGLPTIWKTHYRFGYGFQQASLYRPLTLSIFAIQWELAPDQPALAHAFNVFLYCLLGIFIFQFLAKAFGQKQETLAFFSTIIFMAHPVHTEVVANIKSLDELLAACFGFSAYLLLFTYIERKSVKHLIGSLALTMMGFFAKESTVTLVLCIPFILVLLKQTKLISTLKISSLYLIPLLIYLGVRSKVLGKVSGNENIAVLDNLLQAAPDELIRLATAIKILGLYLWKLVFPHPLVNDYSFNQIELVGFSNFWVWISLAAYGILIYFFFKFRKNVPIISFAIAFYLVSLSLYSNLFFTIGTSFGERLLFLPSLGFSIGIAYLLLQIGKNAALDLKKLQPAKPILALFILLVLYSYKTIDRNKAWESNYTLYSTDIKNCDKSARCHYYMGLGYMKEKGMQESNQNQRSIYIQNAIQSFNQAIAILPSYSDAWGQKGLAHYRLNQFKEAEAAYLKSVELSPGNATSYSNLGSLYFQVQQYEAAKNAFEKALKANPNHLDANANYAATLGTLREFERAVFYFKKAIELQPNQANYYQMLGATYQNMGKQQEANYYLQQAARLSQK
tara:strand:- start:118 stop:1941 length:1824 start_codon:yes stop_codon:yes gene_type:complete